MVSTPTMKNLTGTRRDFTSQPLIIISLISAFAIIHYFMGYSIPDFLYAIIPISLIFSVLNIRKTMIIHLANLIFVLSFITFYFSPFTFEELYYSVSISIGVVAISLLFNIRIFICILVGLAFSQKYFISISELDFYNVFINIRIEMFWTGTLLYYSHLRKAPWGEIPRTRNNNNES